MLAVHCAACGSTVMIGTHQYRLINDARGVAVRFRCHANHVGSHRPAAASDDAWPGEQVFHH